MNASHDSICRAGATRAWAARRLLAAVFLALPTVAAALGDEPQFNVCERQIRDHVTNVIGHTVTGIEFYWTYDDRDLRHGMLSWAVVSVEECPGWHAYDILTSTTRCTVLPNYGKVPILVRYTGSGDGCTWSGADR